MTNKEITLCFAYNLLTLPEDPKGFEKYYHRVHTSIYRAANPDKVQEISSKRIRNKEHDNRKQRERRARDPEAHRAEVKFWRRQNKEIVNQYLRLRRATDPNFRKVQDLRNIVNKALKRSGGKKLLKNVELLGCSVSEFKEKISALLPPQWNWENHGVLWHLDHKRPCASFDLTDPEQQKQCCHWSNWQPLAVRENLSKGSYWDGKKHFHKKHA